MPPCPHDTAQPTGCPRCDPSPAPLMCPRCETPVAVDVLFCGVCGTATTSPFATAERVTIAHPLPPVDLAATRAVFSRGGPPSSRAAVRVPAAATGRPGPAPAVRLPSRRKVPVLIAVGAAGALAVAGVTVTLVRDHNTSPASLTSASQAPAPGSDAAGPGDRTTPSGQPAGPPASAQRVRQVLAPLATVAATIRPLLTAAPGDDRALAELGRQALRLQRAADVVRPRLLQLDLPTGRRTALLAAVRDAHRLGVLLGRIGTAPSSAGLEAAARAEHARADAAAALTRVGAWLPGDPLALQDSYRPFRDGLADLWGTPS